MDLFSLRTFITVKELQSFSKAGEYLLLTQPAISKRIAALEADLDTRLFDRIGKKVLLTEAGHLLYERTKKILLDLDDCRRAITNLSETVSGQLIFATSHHIGLHRLPPVLRQFSTQYPKVELKLQFMNSEQAYGAVADGSVELALVTLPGESMENLETVAVWKDPLALVASPSHPLSSEEAKGSPLSAKTIAACPAILPEPGNHTRELLTEAFRAQSLTLQVKQSTNYLETIKMLIKAGLGWGLLPETMLKESNLRKLEVENIQLERSLGIVHHSQRTLSNSACAMLAILSQQE